MATFALRSVMRAFAVVSALSLTMAACSSSDKAKDGGKVKESMRDKQNQKIGKSDEPPPCPRVTILAGAERVVLFRPGQGRDITDIVGQAELTNYQGSCSYNWDKHVMTVKLQPGFDVQLGPAAPKDHRFPLTYFIAMPKYYPAPQGKQVVPLVIPVPEGSNTTRYVDEEVTLTFNVPDINMLIDYDVILGLQLSSEQIDYNRAQKK